MVPFPYLQEIQLKRELIEDFDEYPFSLSVVKELDSLRFEKPVTFLVGENGSGKSTLLEAIAVGLGFNPEGGSRNFNFASHATHSNLNEYLHFKKSYRKFKDGYFLRAESFYNVASNIDALDEDPWPPVKIKDSYGGKSLHAQSHGESFLSLLMERFGGQGLYLLDEPEAALSPARQLAVLARIHELVNNDSQFIIATHSPILMAYPNAELWQVDSTGLTPTQYQDTSHYEITRTFLNNPQAYLDELLEDE